MCAGEAIGYGSGHRKLRQRKKIGEEVNSFLGMRGSCQCYHQLAQSYFGQLSVLWSNPITVFVSECSTCACCERMLLCLSHECAYYGPSHSVLDLLCSR
jgi:hypothetical protein